MTQHKNPSASPASLTGARCPLPPSSLRQHRFKGYTLEEIQHRRLVTGLKIDVATERLMLMVSPQVSRDANTVAGAVSGFQSLMKWFDMALVGYTVTRRVATFLNRFARRKR